MPFRNVTIHLNGPLTPESRQLALELTAAVQNATADTTGAHVSASVSAMKKTNKKKGKEKRLPAAPSKPDTEPTHPADGGRRIKVSNLDYQAKENDVRAFFRAFKINSANINYSIDILVPENSSGGNRGYCFVSLSSPRAAAVAIELLREKMICGQFAAKKTTSTDVVAAREAFEKAVEKAVGAKDEAVAAKAAYEKALAAAATADAITAAAAAADNDADADADVDAGGGAPVEVDE
ncbi:uncharacterized protein K452DRAFT_311590 [Aplosporella prunicola CBS 121167]|uniref:RRM domain-containing protein n=1 Tax=Aplosporella prunicola CBS 121167 TaxID=1176127 RepID=A0A6A6B1Y3_9PEZI|nr:uncharacterized protein K452DRAFT_311590 [Aplosporella prunicola CBS 121167]KAF2138222.1 hypothetical protein K452DRAFT_311590 [Aplosporella prunicola CBS 121167]